MFPESGDEVCAFSMIYRDNDANDVTARLMRKPFELGAATAFDPAVTMAQVASSGASMNTRKARTTNIKQPKVRAGRGFYYIELEVPDGTNIEVFGFQIGMKPDCQ
jgi:hypothetical protein